jgi:hypothetical protein
MALETVSAAASVAVLNYDLMQNSPFRQNSARARRLVSTAYTGSAVVGDTSVSWRTGSTQVSNQFNSKLLTPDREDHIAVGEMIPPGVVLSCIVTDAAATSIVYASAVLQ